MPASGKSRSAIICLIDATNIDNDGDDDRLVLPDFEVEVGKGAGIRDPRSEFLRLGLVMADRTRLGLGATQVGAGSCSMGRNPPR